MNALRQKMIGARAYGATSSGDHQIDDAPRRDAPRQRRHAAQRRRPRRRSTSRASRPAARGTPAPGSVPPAPSRSRLGCRRWRGSRSAPDRTSRPRSSAIAIVSGSSPVAHGTLQIRMPAALAARELRQHPADDRPDLIDLAPEVGFRHRQRVHAPGARPPPPRLVVLEQVVEVEKRSEAASDDERRQPLGQQLRALVVEEQTRSARESGRAAPAARSAGFPARPSRNAVIAHPAAVQHPAPFPCAAARSPRRGARPPTDRTRASSANDAPRRACRAATGRVTASCRTDASPSPKRRAQVRGRRRMRQPPQRFDHRATHRRLAGRQARRRHAESAASGSRASAPIASARRAGSPATAAIAVTAAAACGAAPAPMRPSPASRGSRDLRIASAAAVHRSSSTALAPP